MIKIIIGKKGSGKTKLLAEMVNTAADTSLGNVVCIEKGDTLTYSVTHKARLIDSDTFGISGYGEYYGMLAGIKSGEGTAGKLLTDDELYTNLNYTMISLNQLLANFREHPKRYINVSVFGKKDKGPAVSPIDTVLRFKPATDTIP